MRYWSKGLARRGALNIDWSDEATEISVEDGHALLASVVPIKRIRGEPPPPGLQVIVAGDTQAPVVWRYISILAREDFESIVKLATGPGMVKFLTAHPRGRRLFLSLGRFLVGFSVKFLGTWVRVRVGGGGRSGQPVPKPAAEASPPTKAPGSAATGGPGSKVSGPHDDER